MQLTFSAATYQNRRTELAKMVGSGWLLLPANGEAPMNYADNIYPFRQDSSFRYFAGHNVPDLVLLIDAGSGESFLYGEDLSLDDVVWTGERASVAEMAGACGARYGGKLEQLAARISSGEVHYLPPYRAERRRQLRSWLAADDRASEKMIRAVIALRSVKSEAELTEMDRASHTSRKMHEAARRMAQPGTTEAEIAGHIEGMAISAGGRLAYPAIVSRDGQILHNHHHHNVLREGDLLLIDAGAETPSGYAGDLTRTPCVGGKMNDRQTLIHETVARAKDTATEALRPKVLFRDVHQLAARVLTEGLQVAGLMRGDIDASVAAGAHALFFPHGLGHLIGLDVHDMEDLGEDLVGYDETVRRSDQFGTRSLRLGRQLEVGFTLTVEPGLYFIPALMDRWEAAGKFKDFINYPALTAWRDFGGIRLEDDLAVTATGSRTLG